MITFSPYPSDPRPRRAVDALINAGMTVDLICLAEDQAPRREKQNALDVTRLPITHRRGGGLPIFINTRHFFPSRRAFWLHGH